jgi:hypothetical protein
MQCARYATLGVRCTGKRNHPYLYCESCLTVVQNADAKKRLPLEFLPFDAETGQVMPSQPLFRELTPIDDYINTLLDDSPL